MYQLAGRDLLFGWLAREPDPQRRLAFLDWLIDLARDPYDQAHRVPDVRAPVYLRFVPLDPPVVLTILIADEFRTVRVLKIGKLP